jgi:hypothetical protein
MNTAKCLALALLLSTSFGCGVATDPSKRTTNPSGGEDADVPSADLVKPSVDTAAPASDVEIKGADLSALIADAICRKGDTVSCTCPGNYQSVALCCDNGTYGSCICAPAPMVNADAGATTTNPDVAPQQTPICQFAGQVPDQVKGFACGAAANGIIACLYDQLTGKLGLACVLSATQPGNDAALDVPLPEPDVASSGPEAQPDLAPGPEAQADLPYGPEAQPDLAPGPEAQADLPYGPEAQTDLAPIVLLDTAADTTQAGNETALAVLLDGGMSCVDQTIIGNPCFDEATSRFGFTVCKNGAERCVYYTPPSPNDCTAYGYRDGEIDYWSSCSWKEGCDNGTFVCRGKDGWKCELMLDYWYWYVVPVCQTPIDAGAGGSVGTGGSIGTGGNVGTGGTIETGGSTGAGGSIGTGGISTGGIIGTGGAAGALDAGPYIDGRPRVNCTNTDTSGGFIKVVLDGEYDNQSNLITQYESSWRNPERSVCIVSDFIGWFTRNYCLPVKDNLGHVVFPSIPVRSSGVTEITYVIDDGAGQAVWSRNERIVYVASEPPVVNRCTDLHDGRNMVVVPNGG